MTTGSTSEREHTATEASVVEHCLDNGMRIVVLPDHRAPILTHMVWYRNGSADDPVGKSGIAHFLEHLMFKGTKAHPAGAFSKMIASIGGDENAFTSYDYTAYFQRVPSAHLATCMAYEADRMSNLLFDESVVAPERDVVLEERRMRTDSSPGAILNEALLSTLFTSHPYGKPVIGWQHEIEGLSKQDAFAYYQRFYTPENAILVVAGDVDPDETIALATTIYGPIAPFGDPPSRRRPLQPKPTARRLVVLRDAKVNQPACQRLHLVPSYATAAAGQAEALDILAVLLGAGQTGQLYERLVMRAGLAIAANAYYVGNMLDASYFEFYAVPAPGVTLDALERAIEEVLADLAANGFHADDIDRAKTRLIADAIYDQDSQTRLAQRYGATLANGGSIPSIASWPERIDAVEASAISDALGLLSFDLGVCGHLQTAA